MTAAIAVSMAPHCLGETYTETSLGIVPQEWRVSSLHNQIFCHTEMN
jgi:hypothetical protein